LLEQIAIAFWFAVGAYALLGILVALCMMLGGLKRIDTNAARAPLQAKLLITPGMIALWPLVLRRWLGAKAPEDVE
jgi:hypothetical protein